MLSRRSLLTGLGALVAAPAVIRTPGLLMPVRTIATTGWVFDPVAMAARCVATIGEIDHVEMAEWPHPVTGKLYRYMKTSSRELTAEEAERRVQAFLNRPSDAEAARQARAKMKAAEIAWAAQQDMSPAQFLRLKIHGKTHLCRPHEPLYA